MLLWNVKAVRDENSAAGGEKSNFKRELSVRSKAEEKGEALCYKCTEFDMRLPPERVGDVKKFFGKYVDVAKSTADTCRITTSLIVAYILLIPGNGVDRLLLAQTADNLNKLPKDQIAAALMFVMHVMVESKEEEDVKTAKIKPLFEYLVNKNLLEFLEQKYKEKYKDLLEQVVKEQRKKIEDLENRKAEQRVEALREKERAETAARLKAAEAEAKRQAEERTKQQAIESARPKAEQLQKVKEDAEQKRLEQRVSPRHSARKQTLSASASVSFLSQAAAASSGRVPQRNKLRGSRRFYAAQSGVAPEFSRDTTHKPFKYTACLIPPIGKLPPIDKEKALTKAYGSLPPDLKLCLRGKKGGRSSHQSSLSLSQSASSLPTLTAK